MIHYMMTLTSLMDVTDGLNANAEAFFSMLCSTQQLLYERLATHSKASAEMRLLSIKSKHNISQQCFDDVLRVMLETTLMYSRPNFKRFQCYEKKSYGVGVGLSNH